MTLLGCAARAPASPQPEGAVAEPVTSLDQWVATTPIAEDGDERQCANFSTGGEWTVSDDQGVIVVRPLREPNRRFTELASATVGAPRGTLFAFDRGEWGGALLWKPEGKSEDVEILPDNVLAVLPDRDGAIAVGGLAHGTEDEGFIQLIHYDQTVGNWVLRDRLDLGSAPGAVAPTAQGLVIVTNAAIFRYREHQLHKVRDVNLDFLYPNSIVARDDGSIYVGMRSAVLRLRQTDGTMHEDWMRPPDCVHLEKDGHECRCGKPRRERSN